MMHGVSVIGRCTCGDEVLWPGADTDAVPVEEWTALLIAAGWHRFPTGEWCCRACWPKKEAALQKRQLSKMASVVKEVKTPKSRKR